MARQRRANLTIEEKIAAKEAEITELTAKLKAAKDSLKQLKADKQLADSQKIIEALQASGKSVDDIIQYIKK